MYSTDFLNYCLGIGILASAGFLCRALYYLGENLKSSKNILNNFGELTQDLKNLSTFLASLTRLIGRGFLKGGDKQYGRTKRG